MDIYYIKGNILLLSLAVPVLIGLARFRILDKGSKTILVLAILSLFAESLAYYMAVYYHNNRAVYNLADILELFLVCIYFNFVIVRFHKYRTGIVIGAASIVIGIANNVYIQSLNGISSYFLFYQALVTITLGMLALSAFLKPDDKRNARTEVHFWFPVILIFCWSFKYLLFTLIEFYDTRLKTVAPAVLPALLLITIITNLSIGIIFYRYPKLHTHVR